jgi:DNA-directed RNA polymerase specialized sigma24 family protein
VSDSRLTPQSTVSHSTVAELFRDHHGELVRLAVLMVGDVPTAEDVVQDVYIRLHSRAHQHQPEDPLPYVRAAVLNGCRSALRRPPRDVILGADRSGQHLLLTHGSLGGGFVTGWISHGTLRALPLGRQPYSGYPVTAW